MGQKKLGVPLSDGLDTRPYKILDPRLSTVPSIHVIGTQSNSHRLARQDQSCNQQSRYIRWTLIIQDRKMQDHGCYDDRRQLLGLISFAIAPKS